MPYWISTIELALLIVLPLIVLYRNSDYTLKFKVLCIVGLYIIWFLSYAFLHELSHLFGSWVMGTSITDYQLIPSFWNGDFRTAYINSHFENESQAVVSLAMPYLRDIFFLIIGLLLLKRYPIRNFFVKGLFLVLFALSPLYDIINNYLGYLLFSNGDFGELNKSIGGLYANAFGVTLALIATIIVLNFFVYYNACNASIKK